MIRDKMPFEIHEKWGFGMAPPKSHTQKKRLKAAALVTSMVSSESTLPLTPIAADAISEVKGLFNRVAREDQWDWFTVRGQLGYPSPSLAKEIGYELANLRSAGLAGESRAFYEARMMLSRLSAPRCLSVFLGKTVIPNEPGAGWIYVLSTREYRDLLKVGMTSRSVEQRVDEINRATGVAIPFGVRGCWMVSDPALAEKLVHTALYGHRIRGDREFFRVDFALACSEVRRVLKENNLELRTLRNLSELGQPDAETLRHQIKDLQANDFLFS